MWPWFGFGGPWGWGYRSVFGYPYRGLWYGYPWAAIPREEEIAVLEAQERWLVGVLEAIRKRLETLRK